MKTVRTVQRIAAVLAVMLVLIASSAVGSFAAGDFIIRDYAVNMEVNEDDTYLITETVDVEFTAPSHGIYVNIPLRTTLDRDGQRAQYTAKIKDFRMLTDQPYSVNSKGTEFSVKIGDPDRYAPTETTYRYSYLYDTGGDHLKDADEVYHNLVGTGWEAKSIDHASFEVVFPKDIDMDRVGIKTGNGVYVPFETVGSRILQGETTENVLGGLTIRAVLPQGYFNRQAGNPVWLFYGLTGILMICAAAGFVMWRRYGKDPVYPVTLEFNPPEGLTAPETAYLANAALTNRDIVSMLLTLADKGYLKIREFEKETGKKKKKLKTCYEIEKLKEYDGDAIGEKTFMDGLFAEGSRVETDDLEDKFYTTIEEIKKEITGKYENKLFDETANNKATLMYAAGWLGLVVLYAALRITAGTGVSLVSILILIAAPVLFVGFGFRSIGIAIRDRSSFLSYVPSVIFVGIGIFLSMSGTTLYSWQFMPFLVCLACCLLLFILGGLCEKKTEWYAETKAKIMGFIDFLKTAEKDSMETLAEQDPGYYYRNLAFAFALGVTAVYAERFVSIAKKAPDWYDCGRDVNSFSTAGMLNSINHMTDSVSKSMTSSPSSDSGGGSFSGGGGGGGSGGGSW